jgi:hypothetical protein
MRLGVARFATKRFGVARFATKRFGVARFGLTVSDFANDSPVGALATLAFLVVFRVLIKLFFSIDILFTRLSLEFFLTADTQG